MSVCSPRQQRDLGLLEDPSWSRPLQPLEFLILGNREDEWLWVLVAKSGGALLCSTRQLMQQVPPGISLHFSKIRLPLLDHKEGTSVTKETCTIVMDRGPVHGKRNPTFCMREHFVEDIISRGFHKVERSS